MPIYGKPATSKTITPPEPKLTIESGAARPATAPVPAPPQPAPVAQPAAGMHSPATEARPGPQHPPHRRPATERPGLLTGLAAMKEALAAKAQNATTEVKDAIPLQREQ